MDCRIKSGNERERQSGLKEQGIVVPEPTSIAEYVET
jgi:hypothetical protein